MSGNTRAVLAPAGLAGANLKTAVADRVEPRGLQALDETARRFLRLEANEEFLQRRSRAFDLDEHPLRSIVDPAGQAQFGRQPMDERPKSDALDRAPNGDFEPDDGRWRQRVHSGAR